MHDWQYFFNHDRSNLNQGTYRIFEPEWKAEILHWFSQEDVAKEQKEDFIQALIDFDDGCGDFYRYRAYFLAAEALSQFPECSLGDAIASQVLKWSYAYFRQDKSDWQILPKPLVKTARKTLELTDRKRVIAAFVHLVHSTESRTILRLAAEKLGELDPGNKSAIAALILVRNTTVQHRHPYYQRSYRMGKIAVGDETTIATLVHVIKTTLEPYICWDGIIALGEIAYGNQTAIAALVQFIETTSNKDNCYEAIASLGKIAVGNLTAIAALVNFLQINQGDRICFYAAEALWKIDPGNSVTINTLVEIIETTQDQSLFYNSANHMVKIDSANKAMIAALAERIETTQDEHISHSAAFILAEIDPGNKVAIATLSNILKTTEDIWVRLNTADMLVSIDEYHQQVTQALWEMLNLEDECVSLSALFTLLKIDSNNQQAIDTLIQLLNTTNDESTLTSAVHRLQQLNPSIKLKTEKLNELIIIFIRFIQTHYDIEIDEDANEDLFPKYWLSYESCLLEIADSLTQILQNEYLQQVLTTLKDYLSKQFYKNSSYRYEAVFNIIWHCAQNLTYPDFHKAMN